jgi:hypothetical protein
VPAGEQTTEEETTVAAEIAESAEGRSGNCNSNNFGERRASGDRGEQQTEKLKAEN